MGDIFRYLKIAYKTDIKKNIAYPANFWLIVILIPIMSLIQIVFIESIFQRTNSFIGYTKYETYVLFGTYRIVQSLGYFFFSTKLEELRDLIRGGGMGTFDSVLMKPVDSQLYATIGKLNLGNVSPVIVGIAIVWYGLSNESHTIGAINWIGYIFLMAMGTLVMYFSFLVLRSLLFWFSDLNITENLWIDLQNFGQYPTKIYQGGLGIILNIIIPITLMAAIPADFLFGKIAPHMFLVYLAIVTILFLVTRWFWKLSVKRYTGFSS